jgi:hypothetical protein
MKAQKRDAEQELARQTAEHVDNVALGIAAISISSRNVAAAARAKGGLSTSSLWHAPPEDFANVGLRTRGSATARDVPLISPDEYSAEALDAVSYHHSFRHLASSQPCLCIHIMVACTSN